MGRHPALAPVLALLAGALLALAFAPRGWWPLAVVCPAVLMQLWQDQAPRRAAWLGFCFGVGTFATGTWWLYISIHTNGEAPIWLALVLMLALVLIMAAYQALAGFLASRFLPRDGARRWLLGLPALWLLTEWWRGWFLSGFPWLSLGYSQTDSWLAGFAPVLGVYGISALLLLGSGALLAVWNGHGALRTWALVLLLAPWPAGWLLTRVQWTQPHGAPVSVAIVQGAIPQNLKWLENNRDTTRQLYSALTEQVLGAKLIVWPESALPELANDITPYLDSLRLRTAAYGSDLVMGIVRQAPGREVYFNSVMALSAVSGNSGHPVFYDKRHLVPYGEYFPVPDFVREWLRLMSLPYTNIDAGAAQQPPLVAAGLPLATTVCYEDSFGSDQLANLGSAELLINVTNDAWFGRSSARYQHFQIARMRALEAQRYMVRAANDGVSALIGPEGQVLARIPEYQPAVLSGTVQPRDGLPPYARIGNWPVMSGALVALAAALGRRRRTGWLR